MSEEEIDRKITVIFATDVVGYSKHMETDESGTVKNLRACEKILTISTYRIQNTEYSKTLRMKD